MNYSIKSFDYDNIIEITGDRNEKLLGAAGSLGLPCSSGEGDMSILIERGKIGSFIKEAGEEILGSELSLKLINIFSSSLHTWKTMTGEISLEKPIIYSITNLSVNSLYRGNDSVTVTLKQIESDLNKGASVIEFGGKTSRPGSLPVAPEEEWDNLKDIIRETSKAFPGTVMAVDTDNAFVMKRCLDLGVEIINDVTGYGDREVKKVIEEYSPGVVCMFNNRGYDLTGTADILKDFDMRINMLENLLKDRQKICLDGGVGYSKNSSIEEDLLKIRSTSLLRKYGLPVMAAISRKSFIEKLLGYKVGDRMLPTKFFEYAMIEMGADVIRVHDVEETKIMTEVMEILDGDGEK